MFFSPSAREIPRALGFLYSMPTENRDKAEHRRRVIELLDALGDARLSVRLKQQICWWFVGDMNDPDKDEALSRLFAEFEPTLHPSEWDWQQWRKLSRKLGFENPHAAWRRRLLRAAAVAIPLIVVAWLLIPKQKQPARLAYQQDEQAERTALSLMTADTFERAGDNGQKRIVLPDSSQVWLRGDGSLAYDHAEFAEDRVVQLDGAAFFDVRHDADRPFRVLSRMGEVRVLGTKFSMDVEKSEVVLVEGVVDVRPAGTKFPVRLSPNQRIRVAQGRLGGDVDIVEGETVGAWRVIELDFVDVPLGEALRRVSIYYGLDLELVNWQPNGDLINLSCDRQLSAEQTLDAIQRISQKFEYNIQQRKLTITI